MSTYRKRIDTTIIIKGTIVNVREQLRTFGGNFELASSNPYNSKPTSRN